MDSLFSIRVVGQPGTPAQPSLSYHHTRWVVRFPLLTVEPHQTSPPFQIESPAPTAGHSSRLAAVAALFELRLNKLLDVLSCFRAAERAGALLKLFDADGDGYLSFDEFRGTHLRYLGCESHHPFFLGSCGYGCAWARGHRCCARCSASTSARTCWGISHREIR